MYECRKTQISYYFCIQWICKFTTTSPPLSSMTVQKMRKWSQRLNGSNAIKCLICTTTPIKIGENRERTNDFRSVSTISREILSILTDYTAVRLLNRNSFDSAGAFVRRVIWHCQVEKWKAFKDQSKTRGGGFRNNIYIIYISCPWFPAAASCSCTAVKKTSAFTMREGDAFWSNYRLGKLNPMRTESVGGWGEKKEKKNLYHRLIKT